MADMKTLIEKCEAAVAHLKTNGISPAEGLAKKESLSFKAKKDAYLLNAYSSAITELIGHLGILKNQSGFLAADASNNVQEIEQEISKAYQQHNLGLLQKELVKLKSLAGLHDLPQPKEIEFSLSARNLPEPVRAEMQADIDELKRCFSHACYRSAIILCGRLLETALHRKYFEATNNDLLEKSPGIGLGNLIAKMAERNIQFPPGITNQIHLINQVRISSVHKKQDAFNPTRIQTEAIMLFTADILEKIF
ncbi:hypothetical protein HYU14_01900 [Candidatus Woesearchaeota archaeon]|nr:hypothetical protein [Candidatus Woesearchaeota archaeon]